MINLPPADWKHSKAVCMIQTSVFCGLNAKLVINSHWEPSFLNVLGKDNREFKICDATVTKTSFKIPTSG